MDTTWFAVDADGNIGVFVSGEAGAVPTGAGIAISSAGHDLDTYPLDVLRFARRLSVELPSELPSGAEAEAGRRAVVVIDRAREEATQTYRDHGGIGPFERALGDALWVVREAEPRIVATRDPLDAAGASALRADASAIGWVEDRELYDWLDDGDTGVFAWSNQDYEAAGSYVRSAAPSDPIRLDELPPDTRDAIARARLPTSFAGSDELQLADHFDAKDLLTWGDGSLTPPTEAQRDERAKAWQARRQAQVRTQRRAVQLIGAAAVGLVLILLWRLLG